MKERIAFVDYIRVIACLLVMVVHASEQFYNMGPVSQVVNEDNRLWVSVYDGFFGRISVPLFMIVSAFLLVPMKAGTTMSQFYHRRFLRILPPFICFLVLYALLPATWGGYLVLAHYIRVHLKWDQRKRLSVGTSCFVIGGLFTAWSFWWKAVPGMQMETPMMEWAWEFCTPNVLLTTFGAFLLLTCIQKAPRWINSLAKLTFGMYLMHIFFLTFIAEWIISGDVAHPLLPVWLAIPVIGLLTFLCCAVTTKLISLIPGSKYIIG
jgi:peptidoglycan/LPS O-acetylase OafA/YrhL